MADEEDISSPHQPEQAGSTHWQCHSCNTTDDSSHVLRPQKTAVFKGIDYRCPYCNEVGFIEFSTQRSSRRSSREEGFIDNSVTNEQAFRPDVVWTRSVNETGTSDAAVCPPQDAVRRSSSDNAAGQQNNATGYNLEVNQNIVVDASVLENDNAAEILANLIGSAIQSAVGTALPGNNTVSYFSPQETPNDSVQTLYQSEGFIGPVGSVVPTGANLMGRPSNTVVIANSAADRTISSHAPNSWEVIVPVSTEMGRSGRVIRTVPSNGAGTQSNIVNPPRFWRNRQAGAVPYAEVAARSLGAARVVHELNRSDSTQTGPMAQIGPTSQIGSTAQIGSMAQTGSTTQIGSTLQQGPPIMAAPPSGIIVVGAQLPQSAPSTRSIGSVISLDTHTGMIFPARRGELTRRIFPGPRVMGPGGVPIQFQRVLLPGGEFNQEQGAQSTGTTRQSVFSTVLPQSTTTQIFGPSQSVFIGPGPQGSDLLTFARMILQPIFFSDVEERRSTPQRVIDAMEEEVLNDETASGDCAICQEDFAAGHRVKYISADRTRCSHRFHTDCVIPWLQLNNTCPVCRYRVFDDYEQGATQGTIAEDLGARNPQNVNRSFRFRNSSNSNEVVAEITLQYNGEAGGLAPATQTSPDNAHSESPPELSVDDCG